MCIRGIRTHIHMPVTMYMLNCTHEKKINLFIAYIPSLSTQASLFKPSSKHTHKRNISMVDQNFN